MTQDNKTIGIMLVGFILFVIVLIYMAFKEEEHVEQYRVDCEKAGGTLLDRTYHTGRNSKHTYTCVDSKVILRMNEND